MQPRPTDNLFLALLFALTLAVGILFVARPVQRDAIRPQPIHDAIHLNTADAATLTLLRGIGPRLADAIITHRNEHGPFQSVDQLDDVKGIGPRTLATVRDYVTVESR